MITYLVALPLAVYVLAGLFLPIDLGNPGRALLGMTWRLTLLALLVTIAPHTQRIWVAAAFATVVVLHTAFQVLVRYAMRSERWLPQPIA